MKEFLLEVLYHWFRYALSVEEAAFSPHTISSSNLGENNSWILTKSRSTQFDWNIVSLLLLDPNGMKTYPKGRSL